MPKLCWYFQLHQPYRLRDVTVFDLGNPSASYFESRDQHNKEIFQKVAEKSYRPMLQLLLSLVHRYPDFRFAMSITGVFVEQAEVWDPEIIDLLDSLARSGQVEFLAETYYHSLASLYSKKEFHSQVKKHHQLMNQRFGVEPHVFRNTELIYADFIAEMVSELGYVGMLTEAVPRYLEGRNKTQVFRSSSSQPIPLLLKHAELSDDVAFRFSDKNWSMYPVNVEKYLHWLHQYDQDQIVNLFMDFETFGEHQWDDTGIFEFFEKLVTATITIPWNSYHTPTQLLLPYHHSFTRENTKPNRRLWQLPEYRVPDPISWADVDRDLTAWRDNSLQWDALEHLYQLESVICEQPQLLEDWRRLQTSDHFYYMCTKWAADGDVHAYFSPYDTPYEAYTRFSNVIADLKHRLFHA